MKATYSPDDNKIRIYPDERLDPTTYAEVRAAGFIWAPRQEIFVAPMWTPERADMAESLAGPLQDEDTSLVERAEDRAERFETYSDKRAAEANRAAESVQDLTAAAAGQNNHKAAQRVEKKLKQSINRAVSLFETSEYWTQRAAGAVRAAKYKERPDVRARRIKKIEADKRKQARTAADSQKFLDLWLVNNLDMKRAVAIANYDFISACFPLAEYPRDPPASQYKGSMSLWSALTGAVITHEQARDIATSAHKRIIARCALWAAHYNNRLAYEKAMLGEQGATDLLKPKERPKQPPICNYRLPDGIDIPAKYRRGEVDHFDQVEMTKEEYAKIYTDYKGTRMIDGSHRIRSAVVGREHVVVFLTDSKVHPRPEPAAPVEVPCPEPTYRAPREAQAPSKVSFDVEALKNRETAVPVADQLYPTPREIAEEMVDLLDIQQDSHILEPSGGTGALIGALGAPWYPVGSLTTIEINNRLADQLRANFPLTKVYNTDFLDWQAPRLYDRIIMNPPFNGGADIKHINHAISMLAPRGVLVALCANGSRQRAAFKAKAEHWENLPAGSFKAAGTSVNVALMMLRKEP